MADEIKRLNGKDVQTLINRHTTTTEDDNWNYYLGANTTILNSTAKEAPDHKIPIPVARKIVNTTRGYAAKQGNISFIKKDEAINDDKMREILDFNNEPLETSMVFRDALINGYSYELHFVVDDIPQFAKVEANQMLIKFNDAIKPQMEYAIRYYTVAADPVTGDIEIKFAEVYYVDSIDKFSTQGGAYILDETIEHSYGQVPVVKYEINEETQGIFQHTKPMIDQQDRILSEDIANELGRFADAYLLMSKAILEADMTKIKELKIFEALGTDGDFVKFLTKEINDDFVKNSANRFERLIYEMCQVPNFNDESFSSAESGIAIAYKLIDFENMVSGIEANFTVGLHKRVDLLNAVNGKISPAAEVKYTVKWMRNLPFNVKELAEIVSKLVGILSHETLLKMFPADIVEDALEEKDRVDAEKEESFERFQLQNTEPDDDTDEDDDE